MNTRINLIIMSLTFLVVVNAGLGINFKQIAYIPAGQCDAYGFIRAFDTNHNGLAELIFTTAPPGVGNYIAIYNID